jgi:AraC-like DNA-binding protein
MAGLLRPTVRALINHGIDYRALLAAEGLTPDDLEAPDRRVPHASAERLLAAAVRETRDPAFGLTAAALGDLADIGLMGQLLMTAPTVRDSLHRTSRFARLLHDGVSLSGRLEGERYIWCLTTHGAAWSVTSIEGLIGGTISRMRFRLGPEWSPLELYFAHPEPPYRQAYQRFFRCSLRFGAAQYGVAFDAAVLALQNPVDTAIAQLIERRAEAALQRLDGEPSCAERVREVLAGGLASGAIGADTVTHALHMSRATLTRKLALEGTSLSEVLDALRRELALEYVRDPSLSMEELARRLAFSDARALRRAFVRWTGTTPSALRNGAERRRRVP